ncbi:MAG: hypothetical protein K9N06_01880 [Candidatus Cloacimonetes bacterium]|nr:hypothetical protein [Candidatus Cloacimonadota bacterium]
MNKKIGFFSIYLVILITIMITGCDHRSDDGFRITSLVVEPGAIYADSIETTRAIVTATVMDEGGIPGQYIAVHFVTTKGYIWEKEYTDENGIAQTGFYDTGETGVAHISAYLEGAYDEGLHTTVEIFPYPNYEIQYMEASPPLIYADEGLTSSEIIARIINQNGYAAVGQSVQFSSDLGLVNSPAVTDSLGFARTIFRDTGETGLATIHAGIGMSDSTVTVTIAPSLPFTDLSIDIAVQEEEVNSVVTIFAYAGDENGAVPDGTYLSFTTEKGFFQQSLQDATSLGSSMIKETMNGSTQVYLNTGEILGTNVVTVSGGGMTATDEILIMPGNPAEMNVLIVNQEGAEQYSITAGNPDDLLIIAEIFDCYGNPADSDNIVYFESSLGETVSPVSPDSTGRAMSAFSPGMTAGIADITIIVENVISHAQIIIEPDILHNLILEDYELVPDWTGSYHYELTANLYDRFGNRINTEEEVWFRFLERPEGNDPQGTNINNVVYNLTDSTSVTAENGSATVNINTGIIPGAVRIEAWSRLDDGQIFSDDVYDYLLVAGPPANVILSIGGTNTGIDMGDGTWMIQLSALITDSYGNPVLNGFAVFFSLDQEYDYVTINGQNAYVGNSNQQGDQVAGTAFTTIIYDGSFTNETITVNLDMGIIDFEEELTLPLQFGELTMICVPAHLDWTENNYSEEILYTQCRLRVRDGQNNPVNKQRIIFTTSLGFPTDEGENGIHPILDDIDPYYLELYDFTGINAEIPTDHNDGYTGPYDGDLGRLYKDVGYFKYECPAPIPAPPGISIGSINAIINGTNISASQIITLFRYYD